MCTCGMTKLMTDLNKPGVEPKPTPMPPLRCVFGWHLYRIGHGMYDDLCVDCTLCNVASYTTWFMVWLYKLTGRIVT
jgi:hypothetical protein